MTRRQKSVFIGSFLALIYSVSVLQTGIELGHGRHPQFLNIFQRVPTRPNLRAYEKQLEDESIVAHAVRPWVQYSQFVLFGDLGEKALAGRSGWLFYKPDMRYLVEAAPVEDPFRAITDFSDQLNRRGIHLLIIPIPGKPALYGDMLTRRVNGDEWMSSHTRG